MTGILEAPKAMLNMIAMLVDACVRRDGDLAIALGWNHYLGVYACGPFA